MTITPITYPRDLGGKAVSFSTSKGQKFEWLGNQDSSNALPTSMTSLGGTITFNDPVTSAGGAKFTTAATVGSVAGIKGPLRDMSFYEEATITIEALTFGTGVNKSNSDFDFGFQNDAETVGVTLQEIGATTSLRYKVLPINAGLEDTYDTRYQCRSPNPGASNDDIGQHVQSHTFIMRRHLVDWFPTGTSGTVPANYVGRMHFLDPGDQEGVSCQSDAVLWGQVRPFVRIKATTAAAVSMSLLRVEFTFAANRVSTI